MALKQPKFIVFHFYLVSILKVVEVSDRVLISPSEKISEIAFVVRLVIKILINKLYV